MIKELIIRLKMPVSKFGRWVRNTLISLAIALPTADQLNQYYAFIPEGLISDKLKGIIGILIVIGIFLGQSTVHDNEELNKKLGK